MKQILHSSVALVIFAVSAFAEPQKGQRIDIDLNTSSVYDVEFDNEFADYLNEYFLINED